jgi:signal transduction histidine kinase
MKKGIARRLSLNFLAVILMFSVLIGGIFIYEFRSQTVAIYKENLMTRADNIASTYAGYMSGGKGMQGYGAFSRFLSDIAMADVWIIDSGGNLLSGGMGNGMGMYANYKELPATAGNTIVEVLSGKKSISESFSEIYQKPTLTVGTPVRDESGKVIGAVILSSPMNGIENAANGGIQIMLVSIGLAIVLVLAFGIILSRRFTTPLIKMNSAALRMAEGHYDIKVKTSQKDEIGELSATLEILSNQLDKAARQSENLERMRRDFITNISHELRTPVTVMRGIAESLRDGILPEGSTMMECYDQMVTECSGMQRLIGDLLDLSKLQNPDFKISIDKVDMHDVILDSLRGIGNLALKKGIKFESELNASNYSVKGDYDRLRQLLNILLDNAVKFTPKGRKILFKAEDSGEKLKISVIDEGCGIPSDMLPKIFDRFYRVQNSQNKSGTGLGLAIAKQIADRHNIQLQVASTEGKGTTFELYITCV